MMKRILLLTSFILLATLAAVGQIKPSFQSGGLLNLSIDSISTNQKHVYLTWDYVNVNTTTNKIDSIRFYYNSLFDSDTINVLTNQTGLTFTRSLPVASIENYQVVVYLDDGSTVQDDIVLSLDYGGVIIIPEEIYAHMDLNNNKNELVRAPFLPTTEGFIFKYQVEVGGDLVEKCYRMETDPVKDLVLNLQAENPWNTPQYGPQEFWNDVESFVDAASDFDDNPNNSACDEIYYCQISGPTVDLGTGQVSQISFVEPHPCPEVDSIIPKGGVRSQLPGNHTGLGNGPSGPSSPPVQPGNGSYANPSGKGGRSGDENLSTAFRMDILPNPFSSYISLQIEAEDLASEIIVYDLSGKVVYRKSHIFTSQESVLRVSTEAWHPGMYHVHMYNAQFRHVQKLVKQ